jgi:hypothetical protein
MQGQAADRDRRGHLFAPRIVAQEKSRKIAASHKTIVFPEVFRLHFSLRQWRGARSQLPNCALSGGTK